MYDPLAKMDFLIKDLPRQSRLKYGFPISEVIGIAIGFFALGYLLGRAL